MRCFSFGKLQNLTRAVFLVASIIARMSAFSSWRSLFSRVALRLKRSPNKLYNWLYRAADACAELVKKHLNQLLAANRPVFHKRRSGPFQPFLFGVEVEL